MMDSASTSAACDYPASPNSPPSASAPDTLADNLPIPMQQAPGVQPTPFDYFRHQFQGSEEQPAYYGLPLPNHSFFKKPTDNNVAFYSPADCHRTTLVYTLTNPKALPFAEFELIVRSLHGFKVESITPSKKTSTVTVVVNYPANMRNARAKLGGASTVISVQRINSNIRPEELATLEKLRSRFGFGGASEPEEPETPRPHKKTRYAAKPSTNL